MRIATVATTNPDIVSAEQLLLDLKNQLGGLPSLIFSHCSANYDIQQLLVILESKMPGIPVHGGTSCQGVMTQHGPHMENGYGLAICGLTDIDGRYGVGASDIGDDPKQDAIAALEEALENAHCPGEVPSMIWLSATPGFEEEIMEGIASIVGPDIPIGGGSAADNDVAGEWFQFTNDNVLNHGLLITVLFPSTDVLFAFHCGYEPTDFKGTITKTSKAEGVGTGERLIKEIDKQPAVKIYNKWADGLLNDYIDTEGNILSLTTLHPLGRVVGTIGSVPYYQLSHPDAVTADGALSVFTNVSVGNEIVLMTGTVDSLISRAGRVATSALETHSASPEDIAGALVVYCAGCMLTVENRMDEVVESFKKALPGVPFIGTFTFGEQGCFISGESHHGNLMISVLLMTKE